MLVQIRHSHRRWDPPVSELSQAPAAEDWVTGVAGSRPRPLSDEKLATILRQAPHFPNTWSYAASCASCCSWEQSPSTPRRPMTNGLPAPKSPATSPVFPRGPHPLELVSEDRVAPYLHEISAGQPPSRCQRDDQGTSRPVLIGPGLVGSSSPSVPQRDVLGPESLYATTCPKREGSTPPGRYVSCAS